MKRISMDVVEIKPHYDVIVIGSGYGGSICASRLSRAGKRVCLLERGKEILPGEFPDTEIQALKELQFDTPHGKIGSPTGLYNIHVNAEQNVVVGCGLGGTSLINANVSLLPDDNVFSEPAWPQQIRVPQNDLLNEGVQRAREMLKPAVYPDNDSEHYPDLAKTRAHQNSAAAMGQAFYKTPINVNFTDTGDSGNHVGVEQPACNNCGDCVSGCNTGAKNTTQMNYLPDAWNHGAEIFCEVLVSHVTKNGANWQVHYRLPETGRAAFDAALLTVSADIVVVAAGTLGSNEIMLRSKANGLSVSDRLGKGFTGNGDVLGFGYNCDEKIQGIGFGDLNPADMQPVGPCITSVIDMRQSNDRAQRMVIEEGSIPGAMGRLMIPAMAAADDLIGEDADHDENLSEIMRKSARKWQSRLQGPYRGAANRMQTYLIMSHDSGTGQASLAEDRLRISWPGLGQEAVFALANENLRKASAALNGNYIENPVWTPLFNKSLVTVHPLGGCNMADDAASGVVDHKGRVFAGPAGDAVHKGLYISDGAVLPTSLAVNPLLTISAITERCCALMAEDYGFSINYQLPSQSDRQARTLKLGIEFTEKMRGFMARVDTDSADHNADSGAIYQQAYQKAYEKGEAAGHTLEFTLTIRVSDLSALLDSSSLDNDGHTAGIIGSVEAPLLSAQTLNVSGGKFQLFVDYPETPDTRRMVYQMQMYNSESSYYFSAYKVIKNNPDPRDIWPDTSTLYVTVYEGNDAQGTVVARGIMHINPADFAVQMTTMKVLNADNVQQKLSALAGFGKHFAGVLWDSYGGVFSKEQRFNPAAPPRQKRQLNAPAPQLEYLQTDDGVNLRLSRYQAGSKGPVMLVHGLGVSSGIFSTDLIKTNLVEYLCSHDYDVWLLDFRVSIDLPAAEQQSTGDQVAKYDFPAAVERIRLRTGAETVQAVVHCWGASTFFMSMLAGLEGIRSIVCSQIANDVVVPLTTQIKTGLYLPGVLNTFGVDSLTAYVDSHADWRERIWDKALSVNALQQAQGSCNSAVCHRVTFNYASLYKHQQLNDLLHDNLHELFGEANISAFEHLAAVCRAGYITDADGEDVYRPHIERLNLPICFIHGEDNECYLPESTKQTYQNLCQKFGEQQYSRHVIAGYGHIDCIFGRNAVDDVYPLMVKHLDKTA